MIIKSVNNMSLASKLISGRKFNLELINFSQLLKNSLQSASMVLPSYCSIDFDISENCFIKGSESVLSIGIFNLILNSIDYKKEDSVKISVSLRKEKGRIIFVYKDNSIGIKPELQQEVFKPYFTKNPYNDGEFNETMGLGLFILKCAVEQAGGNILLSTEFSEGVKYIISLPQTEETDGVFKSRSQNFILNKYSDMFVQLCKYCNLPDLY